MSNTTTTAAQEATVSTTTPTKVRIRPAMLTALSGADAAGKVTGNVRTLRAMEAAGLVSSVSEVKKTAWITDAGRGAVAQHSTPSTSTTTTAATVQEDTVSTDTDTETQMVADSDAATEAREARYADDTTAADEAAEVRIAAQEANTDHDEWEYEAPEGQQVDEPEGDPEAEAETEQAVQAGTVEADAPAPGDEQGERPARANGTPRATIDRILELRDTNLSYGAIAEKLMEEGLRPSRAAAWRGQTVRAIIVRERGEDNVGSANRRKAARSVWVIPTKRDGVKVFASEDDGLTWLNAQTGSLPAPVQVEVLDAAAVTALLGK